MTRIARSLLVAAAIVALGSGCKAPAESPNIRSAGLEDAFDSDTIVIVNDAGEKHTLNVYLAIDYEQKRRGLMFVRDLPKNTGMLFVYEDADYHSIWMKNTYIPLDLIFARSDGSVSSVIHDATPLSLQSRSAIEPVNYVLEVNGGSARRLNIGRDSKILWGGLATR